jgi:hypothetical protein
VILDHTEVLKLADHIVRTEQLYAAPPSEDVAIAALARAMCLYLEHVLTPVLAPIVQAAIEKQLAQSTEPVPDQGGL